MNAEINITCECPKCGSRFAVASGDAIKCQCGWTATPADYAALAEQLRLWLDQQAAIRR